MSVAYTPFSKTGTDSRLAEAEGFSRPAEISGLPLVWPYLAGGDVPPLLLRNSGGKPLRLQAEILAEGSSRRAGAAYWHETALYRTQDGKCAVALRFLSATGVEAGVHRARLFDTETEAASWLEGFDPACDLDADFDVSDPSMSVAQVALKAAALRDRAERLARAYRVMIGELLYRLEMEH
jgi:hypothetical protein